MIYDFIDYGIYRSNKFAWCVGLAAVILGISFKMSLYIIIGRVILTITTLIGLFILMTFSTYENEKLKEKRRCLASPEILAHMTKEDRDKYNHYHKYPSLENPQEILEIIEVTKYKMNQRKRRYSNREWNEDDHPTKHIRKDVNINKTINKN